ncbi:MAG TPA: CDP-alcohol phosphatidyltransferase family protein [Candidatus Thalassarchaeaceae archaeon]|nr:CDP-alcohol phosphatidyltransferase family protein [Candidatus Thalassarchaeaceae archaeon]|tara:strand:- start:627 stop:1304 length:678 start_codon:yes stop_codon:yes gene_type:complete
MFEKLRSRWTKLIEPLVVRMGGLDPSILTWSSLVLAILSFYIIAGAEQNSEGAIGIMFAIFLILLAGVLDALDGALARHQGTDGPYGDFLDHTIDRVVDIGLLLAIGANVSFVDDPRSGFLAGLLTLMGSYMGTQAQSVGLGRIYGGFSRADRLVITLLALIGAAWQAQSGTSGIEVVEMGDFVRWVMLGNSELNGMTLALVVSAWGGAYTFLARFIVTRRLLLQ